MALAFAARSIARTLGFGAFGQGFQRLARRLPWRRDAAAGAPGGVASAPATLAPGRVLDGRYRLGAELQRGGTAVVYAARHEWTGQHLAVKVLLDRFRGDDAMECRFLREAQLLAAVEHPHVVRVVDFGRDPATGALYMAQERLRGEDLGALITREGRLSLGDALDVMAPVMAALTHLHARGLVHRDVKPENVFLARDPSGALTPKLLDLGVARVDPRSPAAPRTTAPRRAPARTAPGVMIGTPPYMAPEQVEGRAAVDARADVWAVAVTLYELLAGVQPFARDEECGPLAVFAAVLCAEPPRLESLAPGVPPAVAAVIHRALSKRPDGRPRSMQHLLGELLDAAGDASNLRWDSAPSLAHLAPRRGIVPAA